MRMCRHDKRTFVSAQTAMMRPPRALSAAPAPAALAAAAAMPSWATKGTTKTCDQCEVAYELVSGCSHITCPNCRYQFCQVCGGKYTGSQCITWGMNEVRTVPFC